MIENLELAELAEKNTANAEAFFKKDVALYGHVKATLEVVVGSAELSIEQLLKLKAGSVVTMLEEINEPMMLKMDGKVVARGALVIVDNNFGFEITEIID